MRGRKIRCPQQEQERPGIESKMEPPPQFLAPDYKGAEKLKGKAALITGGDSGIGRATAVLYAREGADIAIVFLPEEASDAETTKKFVEREGRKCLLLEGDVKDSSFCEAAVKQTVDEFGKLDILVNNAAYQQHQAGLADITDEQLDETFRTNIFGYFYMARAGAEIFAGRREHYKLRLDHRPGGFERAARLFGHQGRDQRVYQIACSEPGRQKDPRKLRRSRAGLDAAECRRQGSRRSGETRSRYADEEACPTGRDRSGICVLCIECRLKLYNR